jgi:lipid-A-disaccharide synthase
MKGASTGKSGKPSVMLCVADPSADASAALLAVELRGLKPNLRLRGLGGQAMKRAGVELFAETVSNAAMGPAAAARIFEVGKLVARLGAELDRDPPAALVAVDSWSMNSHFLAQARKRGIPTLYYIAPQTWASREGRVKQMRTLVDKVACILPFEENYFRDHGLNATYVGHPLWDRIETSATPPPPLEGRPPVVAVLPGSRKSVAKQNWPRLAAVMQGLRSRFPGIRFRIPLTPNAAEIVLASPLPADTIAERDAIDQLLPGCDLALCVSGTAALHVAAHGVPMLVVYYGNPLLWHLIGRWIVRTRTYCLVNLLSGEGGAYTEGNHVVPEYIPWSGSTKPVLDHATRLLGNPVELARLRAQLARITAPLAKPGASQRAAQEVLRLVETAKSIR